MAGSAAPASVLVTSTCRPTRIAFLVDPRRTSNVEINGIVRRCSEVWGGRFNGIFPTDGSDVPAQWWKALVALDPDTVYSLVPLDEGLKWRINRYILPFEITEPRDDHVPVPHLGGLPPLLSVEMIPKYLCSTRSGFRDPFFYYLKDSTTEGTGADQNFILRNFGVLPGTVAYERVFGEVVNQTIDLANTSARDLLDELVGYRGNHILPLDLASMFAGPPRFLARNGGHEFHLVVGDSPLDALYAWDLPLATEPGAGRYSLWLPEALADDDEFLKKAARWIRQSYWSQQAFGTAVSYSASQERLEGIVSTVNREIGALLRVVRRTPEEYPFPDPTGVRRVYSQSAHVPLSEGQGLVRPPKPPFVSTRPPEHVWMLEARRGWMVDFEIQHHPDRYRQTNVRPNWMLPRRRGMAEMFFQPYRLSRVVADGVLAGAAAPDETVGIRIPPDDALLWPFVDPRIRHQRPSARPQRIQSLRPSDKGGFLRGVISLFGGLFNCAEVFGDPFWRDVLCSLSAVSTRGGSDGERIRGAVEQFLDRTGRPLTPGTDDVRALSDFVAARLARREPAASALTKEQLTGRFAQVRRDGRAADPDSDVWKHCTRLDERVFSDLVSDGVFLQGALVTCLRCRSSEWYGVDDLRSTMTCRGCLSTFPLPADPEWAYAVNSLCRNAVRYQGMLPVIQALAQLEDFPPRAMFVWFPCQNAYEDIEEKRPLTDLDIMCFREGKFVIGEVKSDPAAFSEDVVSVMGEVADDLEPDEVVFAAPGDFPQEVLDRLRALRDRLAPIGASVTPLPLSW